MEYPSYGDREWAREMVRQTLSQLREEYAAAGKGRVFECLRGFLPREGTPPSYAEAARALEMEVHAVRIAVHRLRRRFMELLRGRVSP